MKPASPYMRGTRQMAISRNLLDLPGPRQLVQNVMSVYEHATAEEFQSGETWYTLAHVEAERIGQGNVVVGAGVIAALSPQNSWGQNLIDADSLVNGLDGTWTIREGTKGLAILAGRDPLSVLGGRKTRAFYRNILNPDRPGPVTVDRHAIALAMLGNGHYPESVRLGVPGRILEHVGSYQMIAAGYRSVARMVGLMPHQIQAITWLTWRRDQQIGWADHDPF